MKLPFVFDLARAAIALGAAGIVVTVLYLLRERYRPVVVSYLPIWEESVRRSAPLALARRLRRLLSLLLQLAIVALTVWALMDPSWGETRDPRSVVLLVDVSPSMGADDGRPGTRLDEAVRFAKAVGRAGAEGDRFLLAGMGATPVPALSWSPPGPALGRALEAMALRQGEADIAEGLRFALAALSGKPRGEVWILGDGALNLDDARVEEMSVLLESLGKEGVAVNHHLTGSEDANAAVIRFSMRQDLRDPVRFLGMLDVARYGKDTKPLPVRIEVLAAGHAVLSRKADLAGERHTIWLDVLSPPSREIEAVMTPLEKGRDRLASDDRASVTLPEETALRVLAVSDANTYLGAALLLSPTWEAEWIRPGERPSRDRYDVVIVDDAAPLPAVETTGILAIHPTGAAPLVASEGDLESPEFDSYDRDHPVTRWIDLYNVNVGAALKLVAGKQDKILGRSGEDPLIILRESEGAPRILALAFRLQDSDLPMRAAWPLLFLNAVHHLAGESLEVASSLASPGESRIAPRWIAGMRHHGKPPSGLPRRPPLWLVLAIAVTVLFATEWVTYHKRITV